MRYFQLFKLGNQVTHMVEYETNFGAWIAAQCRQNSFSYFLADDRAVFFATVYLSRKDVETWMLLQENGQLETVKVDMSLWPKNPITSAQPMKEIITKKAGN